jgi:hypothetical protein
LSGYLNVKVTELQMQNQQVKQSNIMREISLYETTFNDLKRKEYKEELETLQKEKDLIAKKFILMSTSPLNSSKRM